MSANPILARLGFGPDDRVLLIHVDDMGMSGGELDAFIGLRESGFPISGSAMVPCSGFEAVARWAAMNPSSDLGIHLTLTSEWDRPRWAPLTDAPGLRAADGCFHQTRARVTSRATPAEIAEEMEAQIRRAIGLGLSPSHLDTHMYLGLLAEVRPTYLRLAERYALTPLIFRESVFPDPSHAAVVRDLEEQGVPVFDHRVTLKNRGLPEDRTAQAIANLDALEPGLSMMIIHPVVGEGVTPDWQHRRNDFEAVRSTAFREHLKGSGVQLIDYRRLREAS